jgi:hypothetical protein
VIVALDVSSFAVVLRLIELSSDDISDGCEYQMQADLRLLGNIAAMVTLLSL